jgi:ribosomal protein S18 acetylase RimI-like enzyme
MRKEEYSDRPEIGSVVRSENIDVSGWLILAAGVEPEFGSLVSNPLFHNTLVDCLDRGTAYCVRENDGPSGSPLLGGLLFTSTRDGFRIGWLAVVKEYRRHGIASRLVEHALARIDKSSVVEVTTFGPRDPTGDAARAFYRKLGFRPGEISVDRGPAGESRQIWRLAMPG